MPIDVRKFRVLIPTTAGSVEVLLLTDEDPAIGRSVACIGGTTETADIAAAYHAFVGRPTGIIERLFGHSCYRLDISGRIDAGSSWQLGVTAAHALHASARLAQEREDADGVLWATGSVRPVDLTVGGVSHVEEKLALSLARLRQEARDGRSVVVAIPEQNAGALKAELKTELAAAGIDVILLADVRSLLKRLAIELPEPAKPTVRTNSESSSYANQSRQRWHSRATVIALAMFACVAIGSSILLSLIPLPVHVADPHDAATPQQVESSLSPALTVLPPRRETELLVPETVPFASDRDRLTIRSVYLPAPDFKALALSSHTMGLATDQPDEATARTAAMAACDRAMREQRVNSQCEVYAVGPRIVSNRGRPPMPPQPWIVRNPVVETPVVLAEIPFISDATRKRLENWAKSRNPKALAITSTGIYNAYTGQASVEEATRRALERCGSNAGAACIIVALDDSFVVPIPRTRKPIGIFQLHAAAAIAPELRDEVARRIGNGAPGWSAVAAGAAGNVGTKVGADTETAAVDAAIADCATRDRTCRVIAIGPFLVEGPPPDIKPSDEAKQKELIMVLTAAAPRQLPESRQNLAEQYQAMKGHKALAMVPGTMRFWRSAEWPTAQEAEEAALEGCQIYHGYPCVPVLVDDQPQTSPNEIKSATDMVRVRYAGPLDPAHIPGIRLNVRARTDVVGYVDASGPKAAAYHPWGRVFTVLSAANQRAAEARALADCNADPARNGQDGPCHLYAIANQVVLPQRLTTPLTP